LHSDTAGTIEQHPRRTRSRRTAVILGFSLLLSACGQAVAAGRPDTSAGPGNNTAAAEPEIRPPVKFVLTQLGGRSGTIPAYERPDYTDAGMHRTALIPIALAAVGACQTTGRDFHSRPGLGETDTSSQQWIKLAGEDSEARQFVSSIYVVDSQNVVRALAQCTAADLGDPYASTG
jgi:hypothetical protein